MQTLDFTTSSDVFRQRAVDLLRSSGLADAVAQKLPGDFGFDPDGIHFLETLRRGIDVGLQIASATVDHRRAVNALAWIVAADRFELQDVAEPMELDGVVDLLSLETDEFFGRALKLNAIHVREHDAAPQEFVALFSDAVQRLTLLGPDLQRFESEFKITVDGESYAALKRQRVSKREILSTRPDQIVGNDDYLERGLRLARDVAAFDFVTGKNPKRINPVLFGLGRPGCGKTISAHAIGNYFLDFCESRNIRSQFLVVRRTDWASSFQNASAANLVALFTQANTFDGVTGFYWPDIDTAFASRSDQGLRAEEKQNLGAAFGVFDGTLLPNDGSWFLICDANTMNMDPATVSRIAQQPCEVIGPDSSDDYVRLVRDILLADVRDYVPSDGWEEFGVRCVELGVSGRNVQAISNNIISRVQDFDFPDAYFEAPVEERAEIAQGLYKMITWQTIFDELQTWAEFKDDAQKRAEQEAFDSEVKEIVRRLNAHSKAAEGLS